MDSKLYDTEPAASGQSFNSVAAVGSSPKVTSQPPISAQSAVRKKCKYCGRSHSKGKQFCPAANTRCHLCSKVGHFAAVCLSQKASHANALDESQAEDGDSASQVYDTVYATETSPSCSQFTITLAVNGQPCEGLLDTGATRTILTDDLVLPTRTSDRILKAYNGGEIETLGMADVQVCSSTRICNALALLFRRGSNVFYLARTSLRS